MASQEPVLIIGAGLGGLTLAQALRKQGVEYRLFERSAEDDTRFQGWAISLHSWMLAELKASVRDDDAAEAALHAVNPLRDINPRSEFALYSVLKNDDDDDDDGATMKEQLRMEDGPDRPWIRADRARLRDWLLHGLHVEWDRRFVRYETDATGVTAYFEDGSSARGKVLVGADGISSRVRNQLLSSEDARPKHLPMGLIVGEVEASEEQYQRWLKLGRSFFVASEATDRRLFVGVKHFFPERNTIQYYWMFSWKDEEATKPNYWTADASREELLSYVLNHLDGLPSELVEPMRATSAEDMLHPPLLMRDMVPPELPRGRVTLLGDAVHPMIPYRGEGGNMAMKDGINLAAILAEDAVVAKGEDGAQVETSLEKYASEMRERTTKSVLSSRGAVDVAAALGK